MINQQQNKPTQGLKNIWVMATIFLAIVLIIGGVVYFLPNKKPLPKLLSNRNKPSVADDTGATSTGINSVVKANNQFALNLYSQLKNKPGNIFFSPYSISTALAMVYEGTRGRTAKEMQSVFYFPKDDQIRRSSFASIYNQFNKPSSEYKLSVANALWAERSYHFLKSYLETVKKYYGGKATNLDFIHSTESSRQTINHWVEDKTNNKIKNLLPTGSLNSMTRLVLTNAIYFKGDWLKQFKKSQTKNEDFHLSPTKTIKVPMMKQTDEEAKFNYAKNDKWQVLEMPYKGNKLSMIVLLPKKHNLAELEKSLSLEEIDNLKNKFKKQRVEVFMPKFTFNTKYLMNDTLSQMGMPTVFSSQADFSGMDGTQNLFISKVIHQVFIKVDEKGTEAAAATGVSMKLSKIMKRPTVFRADHPFIFLIQDKENGEVLFLGRVVNPNVGCSHLNIFNVPKSYEECIKQNPTSNNLVCYYDFVIQDNDNLWNYCKKNGRILPPNPPEPSRCRLSYYNPKAKIPKNYDECVELMGPSYVYEMVGSRASTRACGFDLGEDKTMTPEIKNKLTEQSRKLYNHCFKEFYK